MFINCVYITPRGTYLLSINTLACSKTEVLSLCLKILEKGFQKKTIVAFANSTVINFYILLSLFGLMA